MHNELNVIEKTSLHFVDADSHSRAALMRVGASLGLHCEIYADFAEMAAYPPRSGIIVVRDQPGASAISFAVGQLMTMGISLPVVAMDNSPDPGQVVQAMRDGALDYLVLPLRAERLSTCQARITCEAARVTEVRQKMIAARRKLGLLSPREKEVLTALTDGASNKEIARRLHISPRTVEIHRANMMVKVGARHAAEAVRIRMEAGMTELRLLMPQAA
jgi:FixJ family two-component response regulator